MAREMTVINESGLYNAILGYKDTSDSIKRHVDDEDKLTRCFTDSGQSRGIKSYVEILTSANLHPDNYFIKSSYKDNSCKTNKCYLLTKMGRETRWGRYYRYQLDKLYKS